MVAAQGGWWHTFKYLFNWIPEKQKAAVLQVKDTQGCTVLHSAANTPSKSILSRLYEDDTNHIKQTNCHESLYVTPNSAGILPITLLMACETSEEEYEQTPSRQERYQFVILPTALRCYQLATCKQFYPLNNLIQGLSIEAWRIMANCTLGLDETLFHHAPKPITLYAELIRYFNPSTWPQNISDEEKQRAASAFTTLLNKDPTLTRQRLLGLEEESLGKSPTAALLPWLLQSYITQKGDTEQLDWISQLLADIIKTDATQASQTATLTCINECNDPEASYAILEQLVESCDYPALWYALGNAAKTLMDKAAQTTKRHEYCEKALIAWEKSATHLRGEHLLAILALTDHHQITKNYQEAHQWRLSYLNLTNNKPLDRTRLTQMLAAGNACNPLVLDHALEDIQQAYDYYKAVHEATFPTSTANSLDPIVAMNLNEQSNAALSKLCQHQVTAYILFAIEQPLAQPSHLHQSHSNSSIKDQLNQWLERAKIIDRSVNGLVGCLYILGMTTQAPNVEYEACKEISIAANLVDLADTAIEKGHMADEARYQAWYNTVGVLDREYQQDSVLSKDPYQDALKALLTYVDSLIARPLDTQSPENSETNDTSRLKVPSTPKAVHLWLGIAYEYGIVLTRDPEKALQHYQALADDCYSANRQATRLTRRVSKTMSSSLQNIIQLDESMDWFNQTLAEHATQLKRLDAKQTQHQAQLVQYSNTVNDVKAANLNTHHSIQQQLEQLRHELAENGPSSTTHPSALGRIFPQEGTLAIDEPVIRAFYVAVALRLYQYFEACVLMGSDFFEMNPPTAAKAANFFEHSLYTARVCSDYFHLWKDLLRKSLPEVALNALGAASGSMAVKAGAATGLASLTAGMGGLFSLAAAGILVVGRMACTLVETQQHNQLEDRCHAFGKVYFEAYHLSGIQLTRDIATTLTQRYEASLRCCFQANPDRAERVGAHAVTMMLDVLSNLELDALPQSPNDYINLLCGAVLRVDRVSRKLPFLRWNVPLTNTDIKTDNGQCIHVTDFFQRPGVVVPAATPLGAPCYYTGSYEVFDEKGKKKKTVQTKPEQFGFRLGTLAEIETLGLDKTTAVPLTPSAQHSHTDHHQTTPHTTSPAPHSQQAARTRTFNPKARFKTRVNNRSLPIKENDSKEMKLHNSGPTELSQLANQMEELLEQFNELKEENAEFRKTLQQLIQDNHERDQEVHGLSQGLAGAIVAASANNPPAEHNTRLLHYKRNRVEPITHSSAIRMARNQHASYQSPLGSTPSTQTLNTLPNHQQNTATASSTSTTHSSRKRSARGKKSSQSSSLSSSSRQPSSPT